MAPGSKGATALLKSVGGELLQKTGDKVVDELIGFAFNAALAEFGLGGDDNAAEFAAINAKLDKISKQVDTLHDNVNVLALISRLDNVNGASATIQSLFREVFVTMKGYTDTEDPSITKTDVQDLRRRIRDRDPFAEASKIYTAMCGDEETDSILKQEWLAMLNNEQKAIPDPMDAYLAIKTFSLKYYKQLAQTAYLYQFVLQTWWADPNAPATPPTQQQLNKRPEMDKVNQLGEMMAQWDNILEKGDRPIVDRLIVKMAEAFLGQKEEGLQVFWNRSNGWGVGLYNPSRHPADLISRSGEYYVYLHDPPCNDKNQYDDAPFLFYNLENKTYSIRFKWEDGSDGWKDIGPECFVNHEYQFLRNSYRMERYQLKYNQYYTTPQPLKLQMIRKPSDNNMPDNNIWFYIHLAGPSPILPFFTEGTSDEGVALNSTESLMRYKLQMTADDNHDCWISSDCDGQYDTEFAFRLAE